MNCTCWFRYTCDNEKRKCINRDCQCSCGCEESCQGCENCESDQYVDDLNEEEGDYEST